MYVWIIFRIIKRDFSASAENNDDYDSLLSELSCNELEEYQKKAAEQAKAAVEHFKEDFVYKIRSAIKEAYVRRDELNRHHPQPEFW